MVVDTERFWEIVYSHISRSVPHTKITWSLLSKHVPLEDLTVLSNIRHDFFEILHAKLFKMCAPFCEYKVTGSSTPSSDIDVSMLYVRPLPALDIARKLTYKIWGKGIRLGHLLDINLYAHNWYIPCESNKVKLMEECMYRTISKNALLRQIGFSMYRVLSSADAHVLSKSPYLVEAHDARAFLNKQRHSSLTVVIRQLEVALRLLGTVQSSNRDEAICDYLDLTSLVSVKENESYLSCGAYLHVVVRLQKQMRIRLAPEMYIMSFYDNMGFLVGANEPGSQAKYMYRCLDALKSLGYRLQAILTPHAVLKSFTAAKSSGNLAKKESTLEEFRKMFNSRQHMIEFLHAHNPK